MATEARPPPRKVPGALLASASKGSKKQEARSQDAPSKSEQSTVSKIVDSAIPEKVTNGEAPTATETSNANGDSVPGTARRSSHALVQKRLKAVNKKLQRVLLYESQSPESLNPDQKRIISTKPVLLAVQAELQEVSNALLATEQEEADANFKEINEKAELARQAGLKEGSEQVVAILQFLHLFAILNPQLNSDARSFAPPAIPPALESSVTGQEVAALGKLFEQLAFGSLEFSTAAQVAGQEVGALEIVRKLVSKTESGEVLHGVTYSRVREMIHQLTHPTSETTPKEEPLSGGQDTETTAPNIPDDIEPLDNQASAVEVRPAKGGLVFGTVDDDVLSSAAQKAGIATIPDDDASPQTASKAAKGEVQQTSNAAQPDQDAANAPEATTAQESSSDIKVENSGSGDQATASAIAQDAPVPEASVPSPVVNDTEERVNWADEPIDSVVQPTGSTSLSKPSAEPPSKPKSETRAKEPAAKTQSEPPKNPRGSVREKPAPRVDEDGFILMESKRSSQQNNARGRGRGRGGATRANSGSNRGAPAIQARNGTTGSAGGAKPRVEGYGEKSGQGDRSSKDAARRGRPRSQGTSTKSEA